MALNTFRLLLVGIALLCASPTLAQQYTVTDLGMRTAWAISEFGIVAGESLRGGPLRHAALWTPDGVSDLGTLQEGTSSAAFAISGDLIVGGSYADSHWAHAFLYDNQGPGYAVDLND